MFADLLEVNKYYYKPYSLTKNEFEVKFKELFPDLTIEKFSDNEIILKFDNKPYLHTISLEYINTLAEMIPWKQFHLLNTCDDSFVVTYFEIYHVLRFKNA